MFSEPTQGSVGCGPGVSQLLGWQQARGRELPGADEAERPLAWLLPSPTPQRQWPWGRATGPSTSRILPPHRLGAESCRPQGEEALRAGQAVRRTARLSVPHGPATPIMAAPLSRWRPGSGRRLLPQPRSRWRRGCGEARKPGHGSAGRTARRPGRRGARPGRGRFER